jgi:hypothetical protein
MIYKTIEVGGRTHVIKSVPSRGGAMKDANYLDTEMALCGVLEPGKTLADFLTDLQRRRTERERKAKLRIPNF